MQRSLLLAAAAAATLFTATAAHASRVHWSVGIDLPPVTTVVSNGGGYYPGSAYYGASSYRAPTYYPEPVYYPAPAYYPAPVYYAPRPRVWVAPPLPRYVAPWRGHGHGHAQGHGHGHRGHDKRHHGSWSDQRR